MTFFAIHTKRFLNRFFSGLFVHIMKVDYNDMSNPDTDKDNGLLKKDNVVKSISMFSISICAIVNKVVFLFCSVLASNR